MPRSMWLLFSVVLIKACQAQNTCRDSEACPVSTEEEEEASLVQRRVREHGAAARDKASPGNGNLPVCGIDCSAPPRLPQLLRKCLDEQFSDSPEKLVWPEDGRYDAAREVPLARQADRRPAVIVSANETGDVQSAARCASQFGFTLSAAGHRHSYQGWSMVDGAVVIDVSRMCRPSDFVVNRGKTGEGVDPRTRFIATITVAAGCDNALLLSGAATLFPKSDGAMTLIGSCASVGLSGYVLGGGLGDITPYAGYAADLLESAEIVLYNGTIVNASASSHKELYWATRGGGGGNGILTKLEFKVMQAPSDVFSVLAWKVPLVSSDTTSFPPTVKQQWSSFGVLMEKWQDFIKTSEAFKFGGGGGLGLIPNTTWWSFEFNLVYLGPWGEGAKLLNASDLFGPDLCFMSEFPRSVVMDNHTVTCNGTEGDTSDCDILPPCSVRADQFDSYPEMEAYRICTGGSPVTRPLLCQEFGFGDQCDDASFLGSEFCRLPSTLARILSLAGDPSSALNNGTSFLYGSGASTGASPYGGLMLPDLQSKTWEASGLIHGSATGKTPVTPNGDTVPPGYGISHWSHGAPQLVPPNATALGAGTRSGNGVLEYYIFPTANPGEPAEVEEQFFYFMQDYSRRLIEAIASDQVYNNNAANLTGYYDYLGAGVPSNWRQLYFGDNYERLTQVKGMYDPLDIFRKPLTAETPRLGGTN